MAPHLAAMVKIPGKLNKTPEDAERSCTDICCCLIYAAVVAGLGVCIWYGQSKGDISRLDSLPDFQGTQCVDKFIFFPVNYPVGTEGINLHKHVCVEACPTMLNESVVTYLKPTERRLGSLLDATASAGEAETNGLLMAPTVAPTAVEVHAPTGVAETKEPEVTAAVPPVGSTHTQAPTATKAPVNTPSPFVWSPDAPTLPPLHIQDLPKPTERSEPKVAYANIPEGAEEVTLMGYPTVPLGGVLCVPKIGEYQGQIQELMGSDTFFTWAIQGAELVKNYEVLMIAACVAISCSFIFLFVVEWFSSALVSIAIAAIVGVFSWMGYVSLEAYITGSEATQYGQQLAATDLGVDGLQGDLIIGSVSVGVACIVLLCACFQCNKCMAAAEACKDAADCLMTMPSLMLEPLVSFLLKIPFFIVGIGGLVVFITSGDYQTVDLTKPETLIHPDNLALMCALYWGFVFLWTMELLHYISVFVVIYVAEVWFFRHYGEGKRGSFCSMCGPTLVIKAWWAGITKHLGSMIYAALLVALLRPVRWVINLILTAQEAADNPMCSMIMATVTMCIGACMACFRRVLDLTSQIGLMEIAYRGNMGFCEAQKHAFELIFSEKGKWATVEGLATAFVVLGVASISAGTTILTYMLVKTLPRYSDESSEWYVSDPRNISVSSGVVALLMSMSILHHFITITDTVAYCRGLVEYETKLADGTSEVLKGSCWNCFQKPSARETESLLKQ